MITPQPPPPISYKSPGKVRKECSNCHDSGWVCESHPNKPHEHYFIFLGFKFECGGAGMPCICNKSNPPWNYPL